MTEPNWFHILVSVAGGSILTFVPIIVKAYLDIRASLSSQKITENTALSALKIAEDKAAADQENKYRENLIQESENARSNLLKDYDQLKNELKAEILELRDEVDKLQDANIQCALENAILKATVKDLEEKLKGIQVQVNLNSVKNN